MNFKARERNAFSLVELSIVLVILGLLVGGILGGQSLIRASELRTITTEREYYAIAVNSFKQKYFALPGDMTNATQIWGTASDCEVAEGSLTCDGNGDGFMPSNFSGELMTNPPMGVVLPGNDEHDRFWQHLANAGLIEGQYNGVGEAPGMKLDKSVKWTMFDMGEYGSATFAGEYRNILGAQTALLAEELWNIDTKIDDGKPGAGKMVSFVTGVTNPFHCFDALTPAANYMLAVTFKECGIIFREQF